MDDCIFCKIVSGAIPAAIIYENDYVVAIDDIHPAAKVHALIITKTHYCNILELDPGDAGALRGIHQAVREITRIKGVSESGFRVISNCGGDGGQSVPHLHYHVLGGQKLGDKIL